MYIPNDDTYNYPFCRLKRLNTQLNVATNRNSIKVHNVVKSTNKKELLSNFGDWCNKPPNVPSLPGLKFTYMH